MMTRSPNVTLSNIKLRRIERAHSMPAQTFRKQEEFQQIRNSIRNKSLGGGLTEKRRESRDLLESDSLTSITSSSTDSVFRSNSMDVANLKPRLRRVRSVHCKSSDSDKTSFEIPSLRSVRSAASAKKAHLMQEQAREMLETCKEISLLTDDFMKEVKETEQLSVELPEVCTQLESYATEILRSLDGGPSEDSYS